MSHGEPRDGITGTTTITKTGRDRASSPYCGGTELAQAALSQKLRLRFEPIADHAGALIAIRLASSALTRTNSGRVGTLAAIRYRTKIQGMAAAVQSRTNVEQSQPSINELQDLLNHVDTLRVQAKLGHSKVGITLDLYSHVLPGMQEDAAAKIDAAFRAAQDADKT